jgi:RecJ-like exonuclease
MSSVQCPACDGAGEMTADYDVTKYEPIYDKISGYNGFEMKNLETGQIVRRSTLEKTKVECFNCEGSGKLEWDE